MLDISDKFSKGRARPANYIQICKNLADSYPFIFHGVQKDAIQNSMDARTRRAAVKVEFSLIENNKGTFFTITDSNTVGLTGPVLNTDEISEDLPEDHHWARFESFAFTKTSPDALGARGQGKFIFLNASSQYTMFYDSLREDGVYRVGATKANKTGCPILPSDQEEPWEGRRGEEILLTQLGISPIESVGTRVIIFDPVEELVESVESGTFEEAIKETWFRAIAKNRLVVRILLRDEAKDISIPASFPWMREDGTGRKSWILGKDFKNDQIRLPDGSIFRIKRFQAEYDEDETLSEEAQGIAIIHNGMKICQIRSSYLPYEMSERLNGYIEFDRDLDQELRKGKNQEPSHYNLRWRASIPRAIKEYIESALVEFGRAKLGVGVDKRELKRSNQKNAEEWALRQLQKFAKELDLFGARGTKRPPLNPAPSPSKLIGVQINNFIFPDPDIAPRVNWGDSFHDIAITCFNQTATSRKLGASLRVLWADKIVQDVASMEYFELPPNADISSKSATINIDEIKFKEPGEYRLKARLFDPQTGDRVDEQTRRFWVEKDPAFKAPFNLEAAPYFPGQHARRQWLPEGSINNSPTLVYNISHPSYQLVENDENAQREYVLQICLEGALHFVLNRPSGNDGEADYHPLDGVSILGPRGRAEKEDIPARTYSEIMRYMSEFRWRIAEAT